MDPPTVTWEMLNGPGSVDADGVYSATGATAGQTATVRATAGGQTADVAITIVAAPTAPTFTSTPDTTLAVGESFDYAPTATGAPPVTGFTVTEDVGWLHWNETGEYFWGTPTTPGTYGPITITATNGVDPDAVQTFSIVVGTVIDDRVITMDPLPGPTWWEADAPFTAASPSGGTQAVTGPSGDDAVLRPAAPATNG